MKKYGKTGKLGMRKEYDSSNLRPNKYAKGVTVVKIKPGPVKFFPDSE